MGIFLKQIDDVESAILSRTNILNSLNYIKILSSLYTNLPEKGKKRVLSSLFTMLHEVYPIIRLTVLEMFATSVPIFPNLLFSALSKGNTNTFGYVGLLRENNTFYMNSILEMLFNLPIFRQIVYSLSSNKKDSLIVSLQHLFVMLQLSNQPVSTDHFTRNFWDSFNNIQKPDIRIFFKSLLSSVEQFFIQQKIENQIASLFGSELLHKNEFDSESNSKNTESFYFLSLPIQGLNSLEEAIFHFIKEKDAQYQLNSSNNYNMDDENLLFRTHFSNLPPILFINLLRNENNEDNNENNEDNNENNEDNENNLNNENHIRIPEKIDMSAFTIFDSSLQNPEENYQTQYQIHSVLVEVGDSFGSQNIAYIRKDLDKIEEGLDKKEWLLFNDSIVEKVDDKTARSSFKNAYFLCYIKEDKIESIMKPIPNNSIPTDLITYFETNQQ